MNITTSEYKPTKIHGKSPTEVRTEITRLFQKANNGAELIAALEAADYSLVRSTRKVIFLVDPKGGEHNLVKRIKAPLEDIIIKLADINISKLPLKKCREREAVIKCFLTPYEKEKVKALANQAELSTSGYVHSVVFNKKKHQQKSSQRPSIEKMELVNIRYELRHIGGILTELAKIQNQSNFDNVAFTQMIEKHKTTLKLINSALTKKASV